MYIRGSLRTNYRYARTLGIELLTVEDIKSDRWHTDIQVPLIYIKKDLKYAIDVAITPEKNEKSWSQKTRHGQFL